jgi:hypothetical protein
LHQAEVTEYLPGRRKGHKMTQSPMREPWCSSWLFGKESSGAICEESASQVHIPNPQEDYEKTNAKENRFD